MHWTINCIASCFASGLMFSLAQAADCERCHPAYQDFAGHGWKGPSGEKDFVERVFKAKDPDFYRKNCASCHVTGCESCHVSVAPSGHAKQKGKYKPPRPEDAACQSCHRDYFIGAEYHGRAPREDHLRYQRGPEILGDHYLKMLPDVHAEKGLKCSACHSMKSLAAGQKSSKTCLDCHTPDRRILEHRISAHLERLECYACHSAWAAQEYGTFFLHFTPAAAISSPLFAPSCPRTSEKSAPFIILS